MKLEQRRETYLHTSKAYIHILKAKSARENNKKNYDTGAYDTGVSTTTDTGVSSCPCIASSGKGGVSALEGAGLSLFVSSPLPSVAFTPPTLLPPPPTETSSSPKISLNPATLALFPAFFNTYSFKSVFNPGCLSTISLNCSFGNCKSAPKLAGAICLAHRMKPSQS